MRAFLLSVLLVGCAPGELSLERLDDTTGEGWATTPEVTWTGSTTTPETDAWAGAKLTILAPAAGDVLASGASHHFEAQVRAPDGTVLPVPDIAWTSDLSENWFEVGEAFDTEDLPVGMHTFTAAATLPNGATVQHSVGVVRVQHPFAGTYAGLLDVSGTVVNVPISCVGAGLVVIDRNGEEGLGEGDCIVSILAVNVPLHLLYELEFDEAGAVGGTVGVDLLGWFTYNFAATGALDPSAVLEVAFSGEVPLMGPLSGTSTLERISFDTF